MRAEHRRPREIISSAQIEAQIKRKREGLRKQVRHGGTLCSKCLINPPRPGNRYCRPCKNVDDRMRRARNKAALTGVAGEE